MRILTYLKENYLLVAILILAAALRLYHIGHQSPWMDELYTLRVADPNHSFSEIISEVKLKEGFPYLYFFIMKIMFGIFGHTIEVSRLFSALCGLLAVYMVFRLSKQLFDSKTAVIAALLVAFSEQCISLSQEGRPYSFYLFAVVLAFCAMVKFIRKPNLRNGLVYGGCAGLLLNTNFFSAINLMSQAAIVLFFIAISERRHRIGFFKNAAMAAAVTVVLFLPNYTKLQTLLGFQSSWIPYPTPDAFSLLFKEIMGGSETTLFFFGPLFLFFLFDIFRTENAEISYDALTRNRKLFGFLVLLSWFSIYILVIVIKSFSGTPLTVLRYFTGIVPVFFIVFAASISLIRNQVVRFSVLGFLVAFMFVNLVVVKQYYRVPTKTQFREAAEFVIKNNANNEPVYTGVRYWFDYFFTRDKVKFPIAEVASLEALINEMRADPSKIKPFWIVEAHQRPYSLSPDAQQFMQEHFYIDQSLDAYDAWAKRFGLVKDAPRTIDISKFGKLSTYNGDSFSFNIETLGVEKGKVVATGWSYFLNQDAGSSISQILLIKDGNPLVMFKQPVARPDVTSYFKSAFDLSASGFTANYDFGKLEPGTYQIAVYMRDETTKKEGLIVSDKTITRP